MLSRLGPFTSDHSQQVRGPPISLSGYRATLAAALRNSDTNERSTSPVPVDRGVQSSQVIVRQKTCSKELSGEHPLGGSPSTIALEGNSSPARSSRRREDPADKKTASSPLLGGTKQQNVLDQEFSGQVSPAEHLSQEAQSTEAANLEERHSLLATLSYRGTTVAGAPSVADPLLNTLDQQRFR